MSNRLEKIVALGLFAVAAAPAAAQEVPPPPPFLLPPTPSASPDPSLWKGLYVGTDVFGLSGGKGMKGGVGGGGYFGYERAFADNMLVAVQGDMGYAPNIFRQSSVSGFDYASAGVKLGYQMDRLTAWVAFGTSFAKPDIAGRGFTTATDSVNDLVNNRGGLKAAGNFAAGADYAITDNLTVSVAVEGRAGRGPWGALAPPR